MFEQAAKAHGCVLTSPACAGSPRKVSTDYRPLYDQLIRERFGSNTVVTAVEALAGDASTRRYERLRLRGSGAPATSVAMLLADRGIAMSSDELAVFEEAPRELPYLNVHRFLVSLGLNVPEVYLDASEQGVLLLEDIGDVALWDAVQGASQERILSLYHQAIEQLLLLQVEGSRRADKTCIAFQQSFDARLFEWELEHFLEFGIEKGLQQPLPQRDAALLREHFGEIASRLDAQPRFLNHRDYHSWNLYVQGDVIRVIDFQDALLAPAPYDLATLLGDRDTPRVISPEIEAQLLDEYGRLWNELSAHRLDSREIEHTYFLCALQKALKVVGRFHYLNLVKRKPGYMRYLPSTVRQVLRLLPRFPEHKPMADVLRRYLV